MEIQPIYFSISKENHLAYLDKKVASKSICEEDADLIRKYALYRSAVGASWVRIRQMTSIAVILRSRYLHSNFKDMTDDDWIAAAGSIRSGDFTQNTKSDYISISRTFLLWLVSDGINRNLTEEGILKVKLIKSQKITKTPDQLLSDSDILTMLHHPQCKPVTAALVSILYYTGMRPSEALRLRWRDLEFANSLLKIRITDTKTGKYRYAPCTEALEPVAYWRNHYPSEIHGGAEGDNPVFVIQSHNKEYRSMSWNSARIRVQSLSKAALGRPINLYIFRSSDITNSAVKGVPDAVNKAVHWGNQSTAMLSTYLLLKDNQIDQALLKRAGMDVKEEAENLTKPVLCNKCFTMNQAGSEYCRTCGDPLSRSAIERQMQIREASQTQQAEKSMAQMFQDVAEVFGMTVAEFTAKIMSVKK